MSVGLLASATPEQELLLDSSSRFIERTMPLPSVRELAAGSGGVDARYHEAAGSLGWFGMLVGEEHGGGTVSGNGLLDAAAVAAERGGVLQPGSFATANVVAHLLAAEGSRHGEVLARLVAGRARATWAVGDVAGLTPGAGEIVAGEDGGGGFRLDGDVRHVPDAADCDLLVVTAHGPRGLTQFLVAADTPGVQARRMASLDITRRPGAVRFHDVRVGADAVLGAPGDATAARFEWQVGIAAVLTAAESVGAMHRDLEAAVEHAGTRIAFGRPIGSFQAVKHLLADLSLSLEMAKAVVSAAAESLGSEPPGSEPPGFGARDGVDLAHAAKAFVAEHGVELAHGCFQVFGGVGYTWEHDHHLFMRRLAADAVAFGSAQWHRDRLGERIGVG
ncbi:acyl-CoA dehydrogenase [Parafrankia colletiae]|uniref:Acyl-CoA dehydrogenase n=1 Tax=Parafrankia colletiae TaxID=573497 RepID=A0A1S1R2Y0_9ACTN|nr:acyl-CoA dehydrogenase family protein [Parafrankia colletiae]MCK9900234.1 acyl-CoA dehydrogenase family protein [Frankia sp. Cpl3]OHV40277.1 acyl-CoA dehydrogenase [Parafrankia colletiae]